MNTRVLLLSAATLALSPAAFAATVGPGGFDDGYATEITIVDEGPRGTANNRNDETNALGASDGSFFEIGFGGTVDLTFGTSFNTATIYETTFGSPSNWPESAVVSFGSGGVFTEVTEISNVDAQGGATVSLDGSFDTLRITDTSPTRGLRTGGFDLESVQVAPIPLPASALFLLAGLGGLAWVRRKA